MALLQWEFTQTPIGELVIFATERGIARIAWDCEDPQTVANADLKRVNADSARQGWNSVSKSARDQLSSWFSASLKEFHLPLAPDPRSEDTFSGRVLAATAQIPRGQTVTYGEVAAAAGEPNGARAAGNALGSNPIPIVVPCHRVVAANGLGGFGGGPERKEILLAVESG